MTLEKVTPVEERLFVASALTSDDEGRLAGGVRCEAEKMST